MRASKIVAAALAISLVAVTGTAMTNGLANPPSKTAFCQNTGLSFPDQQACAEDLKTSATDEARAQVMARYQTKIDGNVVAQQTPTTPSATKMN